jgi:hypothetical protein
MPAVRRTARIVAVLAAAALPGCGADRVKPPDASRPYAVAGPVDRAYPAAGLKFKGPGDWTFDAGQAPLVASTSSGSATIAIWRYPRAEPLPRDDDAFDAAEQALEQAAKTRDARFRLQEAKRVKVDGARGIELLGTERVQGRERRVRSTHVYAKGAEVVVDAYAAPRDFELIDRAIFGPLVASMKIDPPQA